MFYVLSHARGILIPAAYRVDYCPYFAMATKVARELVIIDRVRVHVVNSSGRTIARYDSSRVVDTDWTHALWCVIEDSKATK